MKINFGKYQSEINEAERVIKKARIFEEHIPFPNSDFDPAIYRNKSFLENWQLIYSNNIYSFKFNDNSLVVIKLDKELGKLSYSFYECPYLCDTYYEFLVNNSLLYQDDRNSFYDFYDSYLDGCSLKENPIMIRYDYDCNSYKEGLHPASHLHIGFNNSVRIGIDKILGPLNFIALIIRQHYPANWLHLMKHSFWMARYSNLKNSEPRIDSINWVKNDKLELYLS